MAYITLLKNVLSIILAFGVFVFVYALYYFYHSLKPPHFVTCVNPSHFGLTWENIVFNTSDGIRINGWFIPSSKALSQASGSVQEAKPSQERKAMILCHGYPFDKGNILPMFKFLHSDYDLLLFDFRAMGESDGNLSTAGYLEKEDIHSAINFLENRGFKKIGLLGLSMGGATVLMASGDPRIQTVVADSPYASMDKLLNELLHSFFFFKKPFKIILEELGKRLLNVELSQVHPEKVVQNIQKPVFIIHGDQDHQVDVSHALILKKASQKIQVWIVQGVHHAEAHQLYPNEYEKKVKEFLSGSF